MWRLDIGRLKFVEVVTNDRLSETLLVVFRGRDSRAREETGGEETVEGEEKICSGSSDWIGQSSNERGRIGALRRSTR